MTLPAGSRPVAAFFTPGYRVATHSTAWRDNVGMIRAAHRFGEIFDRHRETCDPHRALILACQEYGCSDTWDAMDWLAIHRGEDIGHPDYERRTPQ